MKVAIIAPPYPLEEAPAPPLGICYVAAAFEAAGAEVKILDYIISRYDAHKLQRELDAFQPDAVGITSVTLNFPAAAEIISKAKELRPSAVTMMGGPHVSFYAENTLKQYPGIDLLVLGEGERTIQDLVPCLDSPQAWPGIPGIAFREGDRIAITEPRDLISDLDSLPLPARHLLSCSRYQALGFPVSIITGRGCPYACIFCLGRRMVGSRLRYRDPVRIVDEIETILGYGFSRINVADDLFLSKKDRVAAVCREILDRRLDVSWSAFARVNTVDPETLRIMREAGCDTVGFGIESGNQEMLDRIQKKITLEQCREAVAMCKQAGLLVHGSFIIGLPGETMQTLKETEAFAKSLDIHHGYHFLSPFPGTTVRENIDAYDLKIETDDWSRYDANSAIVSTSSLTSADIEKFYEESNQENEAYIADLERQYEAGTISPNDFLRVYGRHRMELTFRLLSEDIIEEHGTIPMDAVQDSNGSAEKILLDQVASFTGGNQRIVEETVRDFINKGYIKCARDNGFLRWYWTHNRHCDTGPCAIPCPK